MIVALVLGLWMLIERWDSYFKAAQWMHIKLVLVLLLLGYHHMCGHYRNRFAEDKNRKSETYYRYFNEAPVLILVAVVILVTLKQPF